MVDTLVLILHVLQGSQLLTSNQLLLATAISVIVIGIGVALVLKRLRGIEEKLTTPALPFWQYVIAVMSGEMMHPHPWAKEQDDLMRQVNQNPLAVLTNNAQYEELKKLVYERTVSTSPDLREHEKLHAAIYLLAMPFARGEAISPIVLQDVKLVGAPAPTRQTAQEHSDAKA